jgi:hypothetical protein
MLDSGHDMIWIPKTYFNLFMCKMPMDRKRVRLKSPLLKILWSAPYALIDYLVWAHLWFLVSCKILLPIFSINKVGVCVKTILIKVNKGDK